MKRLVLAVAAIVIVGVGAWLLAVRMESPQQAAARAEPPAPEPVVVALDRGYLNGPVSMTVEAQNQQSVVITPPAALTGVVTSVDRSAGDTLSPGSVPFRVNGRPVFVLEGAFALYRDIRPGDEGDDVLALQKGLLAAGYALGRPDGKYGPRTQAAVRSMYRSAGYAAPEVAFGTLDAAAAPSPGASAPETAAPGAAAPSDGTTVPAAGPGAAATAKGPGVLQSEVLTVPRLPAVVEGITTVGTGIAADTGLLTLGTGQVVLTSTLPQGSVGALAVDAAARFTDDSGAEATARVTALSPTETGEVTVSLLTEGAVRAGSSYVLTIDNPAAEDGERLLAPVAAVVTRAGRTYVYVREGRAGRGVGGAGAARVGGGGGARGAAGAGAGAGDGDAGDGVTLGEGTEVRVG
ncbi:peptidoglycan-binding domain-containing protein [Oerskovia merdavium]|uniref:Peptidoglycan-binding protein n=1 Tax=Oerskovia merdavium TaxID=2762227 RepID=A0ABR8TUT3_9CELL|nr:peptidoglycan-binding domain-containing protein [Oerskovia merdavium]MBD7979540.1 peptidoglycan-binding protein [Oerskovia merdavium]